MSRKVVGTCINICGEDQCVFCILKEMLMLALLQR